MLLLLILVSAVAVMMNAVMMNAAMMNAAMMNGTMVMKAAHPESAGFDASASGLTESALGGLDLKSNRLWHPYQLFQAIGPGGVCALSYSQALGLAHGAWDDLLRVLGDRVELLAFEDTVMQYFKHTSLRRTLRPLHLVEGTEVSGLRNGELTLLHVNDTEPAVYFSVKLKPLKIRGALRTGDNTHLLRAFLVDMTFRFRTVVDGRDAARLHGPRQEPGDAFDASREVAATRYGLARAGHVTHLQVASGDRTETAFGQEVEALLAGAAVTSVWYELQRAASVHTNWERERPRPLHWDPTQAPRSWGEA